MQVNRPGPWRTLFVLLVVGTLTTAGLPCGRHRCQRSVRVNTLSRLSFLTSSRVRFTVAGAAIIAIERVFDVQRQNFGTLHDRLTSAGGFPNGTWPRPLPAR